MELLETIQFSLLRLASAVCVPLALFTVVTTARRPDPYERYAWGIFSLGLLTLTWLLNAYLNQNSRLLAFVYPLFFGWVALAGPAYHYSLVGRRPLNLSFTLLHLISSAPDFSSFEVQWGPANGAASFTVFTYNGGIADTAAIDVTIYGIGIDELDGSVILYPTPTEEFVYIKGAPTSTLFELRTVTGELVLTGSVSDRIDLSGVPSGTLLLTLKTNTPLINIS